MLNHRLLRQVVVWIALLGCGLAPHAGWARGESGRTGNRRSEFRSELRSELRTEGSVRFEKDVVYGTQEGVKLLMDVYQPDGYSGKRPGILFVHGGGWAFGDKGMYAPLARALAAKGFVAFSINYRLLPKFHYPAQLDDTQRAMRYIRAHSDTYNLDPDRIGAVGDSAGGYLVAMLGVRDTRDNSDTELAKYSSRVQCVVDFYGPADFTIPPVAPHVSEAGIQIVEAFLNQKRNTSPDVFKQSSPISYVDKQSAPFLIIHGTDDSLVPQEQSERLYAALKTAQVDVTLLLAYKQAHGFVNAARPLWYGAAITEFLSRVLNP